MTTIPVLLVTAVHGPARAQEQAASNRARDLLAAVLGPTSLSTSVSHTRGISVAAGVIGSRARIGVDLETDHVPDPRTGRFFLRAHELAWLDTVASRPAEHMRLWTVKEALFKSDPANAGTVMLSYALADPAARCGYARREPGGVRFGYGSARLGGRYLSIAACLSGLAAGSGTSTKGIAMNTEITQDTGSGQTAGSGPTERSGQTARNGEGAGNGQTADSGESAGNGEAEGSGQSAGTNENAPAQGISTEAVLGRIAEVLAVPPSELNPRTAIRELVRESFMLVELVIDLQEEFGTYFTQEELREIETIGELVTLLQASPRA